MVSTVSKLLVVAVLKPQHNADDLVLFCKDEYDVKKCFNFSRRLPESLVVS